MSAKVFQTGAVTVAANRDGISVYVHQEAVSNVESFDVRLEDGKIVASVGVSILASEHEVGLLKSLGFVVVNQT